ncbi:hypothetical protein QMN03_18415 [Leptospira santarosai]|uniref:hypothetical protein n=1 Tax=Leptospira santarosai TaxID=28183 RepID=UPI0024AFE775|nr:hypothetical protein [Leptospira santarosai]MDI7208834.1 hypothetical protein [Leptospira santarosai]
MNLVNKISLIGILLVCLQGTNCLFTVKPDYNIEKFESSTKPKAAIGTRGFNDNLETIKPYDKSWEALSKHIDLATETYKNGVKLQPMDVYIGGGGREVKDNFGLIGLFNLCILIPCWESKDIVLTLRYYVDDQLEKEESYTKRMKYWGWAPLFLYNLIALPSTLQLKNEFENPYEYRYLILNDIAPNIAKTLSELETKRNQELAVKFEKETAAWEKVNKNSLAEIIEFNRNVPDGEMKNKANEFLVNLLNKKVQTYLERQFPFVKPYLMNDLVDFDGSNFGHKFYQVFRGLILGINPESGFKVETHLSQKDGKIIWRIDSKSETHFLYFNPYKKNMTLEKIISKKNGYEENLNSQETYILGKYIFNMFAEFPTYNHTDVEFLDKIN